MKNVSGRLNSKPRSMLDVDKDTKVRLMPDDFRRLYEAGKLEIVEKEGHIFFRPIGP